ncbi:MAG TPA: 2-succinyl-6-hydroxy-2,4-cyclohexadiene-1-carboxylate synthase [Chloroflexia bacterium]|nr:2-succinyl-6-hydroxy-2,4-cyclohexadiene-1-carboxylate synthase [Chloroflexia bacterium]
MALIRTNDVEYYVETLGDGEPLLLLHGFTGSTATWARQQAAWAGHYRTIAVDLLGHGRSAAPADPARYRMERTVADLVALLDALALPRVHLLGYSLGGRVALHLAAAHPARIGALVLESASPGLADADERAARVAADQALAARIEQEGVPAFVAHWETLPLWASQARLPEPVRAALHRQRLENRPQGLAHSLRGLGTGAQAPLQARLPALHRPVLVIAGALDPKFATIATAMAAALPQAQLAIVPEAGHAVHLEQPAHFDRLVLQFLPRLAAGFCSGGGRLNGGAGTNLSPGPSPARGGVETAGRRGGGGTAADRRPYVPRPAPVQERTEYAGHKAQNTSTPA